MNNWYVVTGGPSTGKTTLLTELEKLGHKTVPEAARAVIDEALAKGISVKELRVDEKRFQEDVAHVKKNVEAAHDPNMLTFFDRGMHDTIAYMRHYNFVVESWVSALMNKASYQKIFLLDPLPTYKTDYARTENEDFTKHLHELLHDAYTKYGMEPVVVPAVGVEDRVKFVLDRVKT